MDGPFKTPRGPSKLSSKYKRILASRNPDESMVLAGNLGPIQPPQPPDAIRWESTLNLHRRRLKSPLPHPIVSESSINDPVLIPMATSHQPHRIPRPDFQDLDGVSIFTEDQTLYHSAHEEPLCSSSASDTPLDAHIFFSVDRRRSLAFQRRQPKPIWASDSEDESLEPKNRRQSVLGRNPVILLSSESDSEEDVPPIPPPDLTDPSKERLVGQWVQTSPFHSPQPLSLSDFEADVEDESDEEEPAANQDSPLTSEATSKRLSWAENCEGYPKNNQQSFSHQTSFPTVLDESCGPSSDAQSDPDSDLTKDRFSKALQVSLTTEDEEQDPEVTQDTVSLEPSLLGTEPLHLHLTLSTQCSTPPVTEKSIEETKESSSPEEETRFQQFLQKLKRDREERAFREENTQRPIEDFLVNDSDEEALMPVGSPPKSRYFQEPIALSSSDDRSESSPFKSKNRNRKSPPKNRVLSESEETDESYKSILKTLPTDERKVKTSVESLAESSTISTIVISDSDDENKENQLPDIPLPRCKPKKIVKPKKPTKTVKTKDPATKPNRLKPISTTLSFMESLCHPDATKYLTKFQTHRDELARKLYKLFNEQIFAMSLPTDMELMWSPRLLKTAGRCWQKSRLIRGDPHRFSSIELSSKVLDSSDRLRDTLIHEMCHAAAWIISGYRDGHGPIWRDWANRSMREFPELPIINRCHNYAIRTKFTYRCVKCGYQLGRHSKSLDTDRKVCGLCRGRFELLVNRKAGANTETPGRRVEPTTPRTPNKFALFVKENYKHVRLPGVDHRDAMMMLSSQFALSKIC
ncbi:hypothetical protein TCAL_03735 [Tigriopus californicus]|uniref:SprT-like domain-containing protein n=1 Tax=Tigriopus californicus TaxID=6832 RepID=A0A553NPW6_TIGCA|nr:hypothetical protein TCAL_03735 [Tigriopus californicus]